MIGVWRLNQIKYYIYNIVKFSKTTHLRRQLLLPDCSWWLRPRERAARGSWNASPQWHDWISSENMTNRSKIILYIGYNVAILIQIKKRVLFLVIY